MSKLSGNGAPSRKTKGAMGDIYMDISTGKMYECVLAYRDDADAEFDCQWKELPEKTEIKSEKIPGGKIQEKQTEEAVVEEPVDVVEELKAEEGPALKRTNYAAYSKNNKKHNK